MNPNEAHDELQGLLADLFDGSLSAAERERLNVLLRTDAEARELFLDLCDVHAALVWEHGLVVAPIDPPPDCVPSPARRRRRPLLASILGVGLCAAVLLVVVLFRSEPLGPVVARVIERIDAVGTAGNEEWTGDVNLGGEYVLERGLVQVEYPSGVSLLIEGPARFASPATDRILLHAGRLSATVPPEGTGFTVETPTATVVDFGTEFSVDVDREANSEVHVFEGRVRVEPKPHGEDGPRPAVDLRTAEAVRIGGATSRPSGIDLATDRFIRSLDEPRMTYAARIVGLGPVAYFRMPIRKRGLVSQVGESTGRLLTGAGRSPVSAPGRIGGALRVGGGSMGRGGVVESPPTLGADAMSFVTWIRADGRAPNGIVLSDLDSDGGGRFVLSLDDGPGAVRAGVRAADGSITSCRGETPLLLGRWHHVAMTADGDRLRLYVDGRPAGEARTPKAWNGPVTRLWFGVDDTGERLWDGRIDEVALFDRALSGETIAELFASAE